MRQDMQRQEAMQSLRQQELRLQMEQESQRQHELLRIGRTYTPPALAGQGQGQGGYGGGLPPPPPGLPPGQQGHEGMAKRR